TCLQYICLQRSEFLRLILIIFCFNIKNENFRWGLIDFVRACQNCIIDVQNCSMKICENVEVLIRLNSAESILKREVKPINTKLYPSLEEMNFRSLLLHTQLALERLTSHENESFKELLNFVEFQLKAATICIEQIRNLQTKTPLEPYACPHPLDNIRIDINQQPALFDESNILPIKDEVFEACIAESVQTTEVTLKNASDDVRSKIDDRSKSNLLMELKSVLTVRHDLMLEREWKVVSEKQNITFDEFKQQSFAFKNIGADNSDEQSMDNFFGGREAQNSTIRLHSRLPFGNFRDELSNAVSRLKMTQREMDFVGDDEDD
uniref:Uncharacterized protein n=1 Tax=Romanomermis culicivorax TaxID=13658 RepID=A0A915K3D0_ROMCU